MEAGWAGSGVGMEQWEGGSQMGVVELQKMSPPTSCRVIKQGSGDSRPIGARHGDTAANHTDLQSRCGRTCVFAVRVWSNL